MVEKLHKTTHLPTVPGVYFFIDEYGKILYIGKAKNIKQRVLSYFRPTENNKIQQLTDQYHHISYITTNSELQALLLEATLVHQHKPPFNTLLKEGNPFLYLVFIKPTKDNELPRLELVRTKKYKNANYYGPFIAKKDARKLFDYLLNTFQLYLCNKKIPSGCLDYHINRCAGICMENFDVDGYRSRLTAAEALLQGKKTECLSFLNDQIKKYNRQLLFEKSRTTANQIETLTQLFEALSNKQKMNLYKEQLKTILEASLPNPEAYNKAAKQLQELLQLPTAPQTIDCFDISHCQSHQIVAAAVRFTNGKPDHAAYRRFIIRSITQQDDYKALKEAVTRRYKNPADLPDLVMIDGGKGQRAAACPLIPNTTCISLAKREERLFSQNNPEGVLLDPASPAGALLITLRNHTHNQAIGLHRIRAKKTLTKRSNDT